MSNHKPDTKVNIPEANPAKPFYVAKEGVQDAPAQEEIAAPSTKDGIPTVVNGQELSEMQIQALREARARKLAEATDKAKEIGGAKRETNPTRYGDWEKSGRAIDFS